MKNKERQLTSFYIEADPFATRMNVRFPGEGISFTGKSLKFYREVSICGHFWNTFDSRFLGKPTEINIRNGYSRFFKLKNIFRDAPQNAIGTMSKITQAESESESNADKPLFDSFYIWVNDEVYQTCVNICSQSSLSRKILLISLTIDSTKLPKIRGGSYPLPLSEDIEFKSNVEPYVTSFNMSTSVRHCE